MSVNKSVAKTDDVMHPGHRHIDESGGVYNLKILDPPPDVKKPKKPEFHETGRNRRIPWICQKVTFLTKFDKFGGTPKIEKNGVINCQKKTLFYAIFKNSFFGLQNGSTF
jgi:hypothetical protein